MVIESLTTGPGYTVLRRWIPLPVLDEISRIKLVPQRGKTAEGQYWKLPEAQPELALWWSQQISQHAAVRQVTDLCRSAIGTLFSEAKIYAADCIVNTGLNQHRVYPHIDTPYRFAAWQRSRDLLAVQFLVPLVEFTAENGATAIVEHSHRYLWDIKELYRGVYDQWFLDNHLQILMQPGDILAYNPRLVHSTMPNHTDKDRRALLISVMDQEIVTAVAAVDASRH